MRALEFNSIIKNNNILIPENLRREFSGDKKMNVRVIVLLEDNEINDNLDFKMISQQHFLNGYSDSDEIYDHE
jgi:hypothetical protein